MKSKTSLELRGWGDNTSGSFSQDFSSIFWAKLLLYGKHFCWSLPLLVLDFLLVLAMKLHLSWGLCGHQVMQNAATQEWFQFLSFFFSSLVWHFFKVTFQNVKLVIDSAKLVAGVYDTSMVLEYTANWEINFYSALLFPWTIPWEVFRTATHFVLFCFASALSLNGKKIIL